MTENKGSWLNDVYNTHKISTIVDGEELPLLVSSSVYNTHKISTIVDYERGAHFFNEFIVYNTHKISTIVDSVSVFLLKMYSL